jgi:hypothetical protein
MKKQIHRKGARLQGKGKTGIGQETGLCQKVRPGTGRETGLGRAGVRATHGAIVERTQRHLRLPRKIQISPTEPACSRKRRSKSTGSRASPLLQQDLFRFFEATLIVLICFFVNFASLQ